MVFHWKIMGKMVNAVRNMVTGLVNVQGEAVSMSEYSTLHAAKVVNVDLLGKSVESNLDQG